jgi:hypothetical protein
MSKISKAFRFSKDTVDKLKLIAEKNKRSETNMLAFLIEGEFQKMEGDNNMKKQFTIIVKGNQCHGYYANVATTYTKWKCSVNIDSTGYVEKVESEFITGIEKSDFTKSLVEKTKEFKDLVENTQGHYPDWLL